MSITAASEPATSPPADRPALSWRPSLALAAGAAGLLLALSGRYGYHVDELYFRVAAQHLAWGYVDQPSLVPLLAKAEMTLFGDNLVALRIAPALLTGVAVFLVAAIAREFGGGRSAQVLAAGATICSTMPFGFGHVLHTYTPDLLCWLTLCLVVLRILRTGDERLWPVAGAVAGLGLYAKYLIALLVVCLLAGILLAGPRRILRSRYLLAGAAIGLVIASPGILWQATHGWPQLEFARASSNGIELASRIDFLPTQLLMIGLLLTPVWIAGLVALLRRPQWRAYRAVGVAYPVMVVLLIAVAGKSTYTTGLLTVLLAAGCVVTAGWAKKAGRRILLGAALIGNAALALVMTLPILPVMTFTEDSPLTGLAVSQLEQTGWPELTAQVASVYQSLSPAEQQRSVIFGANYHQAAAIAKYGSGLPQEYSGHNSYYDFGRPGDDKDVVIAVGAGPDFVRFFGRCEQRATLNFSLPHLEQGKPVAVCRDPRMSWEQIWPQVRWVGLDG
ncbi:glycosyltransferase family 39 protein [Amycolatopsis sp.]|uniref:glycosyltransferase family 39 protein n=1 Tax=Amycolatopsis sp. TaxID=37632 RepID=UPI002D810848|nr:glycosyltransferase family 39 protein [Amycolatopsis sp.]HET6708333.1 glycosyltransferase family 39 protein [Amycolatopsis sp.]